MDRSGKSLAGTALVAANEAALAAAAPDEPRRTEAETARDIRALLRPEEALQEIIGNPKLFAGLVQDVLDGVGRRALAQRHGLPLWQVDDFAARCTGLLSIAKTVGVEQARMRALRAFEAAPSRDQTHRIMSAAQKLADTVLPASPAQPGSPLVNIELGSLFRDAAQATSRTRGGFDG